MMSNVIIASEGRHLVHDGRLVGGIWFQPVYDESFFFKDFNPSLSLAGERRVITGLSMSLLGPWSENYFHWITQFLPKLELADRVVGLHKIDHFLLPKGPCRFQGESLEKFGIDTAKLVLIDPKMIVEAEHLLITSYPSENGLVSPWTAEFLRSDELFQNIGFNERRFDGPAVFLDRHPKRGKRHIQNREEVMSMLSSMGVDTFDCGDLSFAAQVSACANARLIIGVHGAAMVNMVFAPQRTRIIELLPRNYPIPCFEYLANVCQHRYVALLGSEPGPLPGRDRIPDADIIVPTRRLHQLIQDELSDVRLPS
jgi:capsular polysaccharide biosynthesis protein